MNCYRLADVLNHDDFAPENVRRRRRLSESSRAAIGIDFAREGSDRTAIAVLGTARENVSNTPDEARRLARRRRRHRNCRCVLAGAAELERGIAALDRRELAERCARERSEIAAVARGDRPLSSLPPERVVRAMVHVGCHVATDPPVIRSPRGWIHRCSGCDRAWNGLEIRRVRSIGALGLRMATISEIRFVAAAGELERRQSLNALAYGEEPEIPEGTESLAPAPGWLGPYRPR